MKRKSSEKEYKVIKRILILCILCIVGILLLLSIIRIRKKYSFVKNQRNELRTEIKETQESINHLETSLEYLDSEEGTERALREQFRVAGEGEELIVIVPDQEN